MRSRIIVLIFIIFIIYSLFFKLGDPVFAEYVLPYPSYMPGNKLYPISRIIDKINNWWYFGNIAQIKYHLGLSDKYLVEAKTLFEYKQYLLGVDALKRSTREFELLPRFIQSGMSEHKNMSSYINTMKEAAAVHKTILQAVIDSSPESFQWIPEKAKSSDLQLHNELKYAQNTLNSIIKGFDK